MASSFGVTGKQPIIPLIPQDDIKDEDHATVTLTRQMDGNDKRKVKVFVASDPDDIEGLLRTLKDFEDANEPGRLEINGVGAGALRFTYFRQCLAGTVRDDWDVAKEGLGNTADEFNVAKANLINTYILPTDLEDQKVYMETVKKPYKMSVNKLAQRFRYMNNLMQYFPGTNRPPFNENALKRILFKSMLEEWRDNFVSSGQELNADGYSYRALTRYMQQQEAVYNSKRPQKKRAKKTHESPKKSVVSAGSSRSARSSKKAGDCPFHPGSHDWEDCFGNPHGKKFKPEFKLVSKSSRKHSKSSSLKKKSSRKKGKRGENYHVDSSSESSQESKKRKRSSPSTNTSGSGDASSSAESSESGEVAWDEELAAALEEKF